MAAFKERKAALMAYCRIDDLTAEEETLLESMYEDAAAYLAGAGIRVPVEDPKRAAQFDQCVNALVLDAWDHRGSQSSDRTFVENPAFRQRLNQLKLTEPHVSDSDTAGRG